MKWLSARRTIDNPLVGKLVGSSADLLNVLRIFIDDEFQYSIGIVDDEFALIGPVKQIYRYQAWELEPDGFVVRPLFTGYACIDRIVNDAQEGFQFEGYAAALSRDSCRVILISLVLNEGLEAEFIHHVDDLAV